MARRAGIVLAETTPTATHVLPEGALMSTLIRFLPRTLWILTAGIGCGTVAAQVRPNIVVIVSDDQGFGDASCSWKTDLKTPVMDAI